MHESNGADRSEKLCGTASERWNAENHKMRDRMLWERVQGDV